MKALPSGLYGKRKIISSFPFPFPFLHDRKQRKRKDHILGQFLGSLERDLTKDVDPNVDFYKGHGPQTLGFTPFMRAPSTIPRPLKFFSIF